MLVGGNDLWSLPKVVAKSEMSVDVRRTDFIAVHLDKTPPGARLVLCDVTPPRKPKLTPPVVTDLFEVRLPQIHFVDASDDRQEIKDRLCPQAWDGR
ncbi:hypothetical protein AIGOOFII_3999 [Methylobacterium marchantiae]|nr:hypothetical protein AIGOOFII_3999 [Methylobacterium marchantiae]